MFDLDKDISEKINLSKTYTAKAQELHDRMIRYLNWINAQMPVINPSYDPKAERNTGKQGGNKGFAGMDKNGDSKVSRDEFTGPPRRFDILDKDKDGFISQEEFSAGLGRKIR